MIAELSWDREMSYRPSLMLGRRYLGREEVGELD